MQKHVVPSTEVESFKVLEKNKKNPLASTSAKLPQTTSGVASFCGKGGQVGGKALVKGAVFI